MSKQTNERNGAWSVRVKRAMQSKGMSERCEWKRKWTSEWLSTYVSWLSWTTVRSFYQLHLFYWSSDSFLEACQRRMANDASTEKDMILMFCIKTIMFWLSCGNNYTPSMFASILQTTSSNVTIHISDLSRLGISGAKHSNLVIDKRTDETSPSITGLWKKNPYSRT